MVVFLTLDDPLDFIRDDLISRLKNIISHERVSMITCEKITTFRDLVCFSLELIEILLFFSKV